MTEKLLNVEVRNLYSSPDNVRNAMKMRNAYKNLVGKPEGRDNLQGFGVDRIILKRVLKT
jgi:hypothetical protein